MLRAAWSMAIDLWRIIKIPLLRRLSVASVLAHSRKSLRTSFTTMHQLCPLANLYLFKCEFSIAGAYSMYRLLVASSTTNNDHWWPSDISHERNVQSFIVVRNLFSFYWFEICGHKHFYAFSTWNAIKWSTRKIYWNAVDFNTFMGDRKQQ